MTTADPATPTGPLAVLRTLWTELPLLATLNLLCCLAALPALTAAFTGHPLFVPLLAALPAGAVGTAAYAVGADLLAGRHLTARQAARRIATAATPGLRIALPLGLVLTAGAATLALQAHQHHDWLLISLAADGAATLLLAAAAPYAAGLATGPHRLRGRRLWLTALTTAATNPATTLAALFLTAVPITLPLLLGPATLLVTPAPVALLVAATLRHAGRQGAGTGASGSAR